MRIYNVNGKIVNNGGTIFAHIQPDDNVETIAFAGLPAFAEGQVVTLGESRLVPRDGGLYALTLPAGTEENAEIWGRILVRYGNREWTSGPARIVIVSSGDRFVGDAFTAEHMELERANRLRMMRRDLKRRYNQFPSEAIAGFGSDEVWTRVSGVDDSDVVIDTEHVRYGFTSLKITSQNATNTYAQLQHDPAKDLSVGNYIEFDVYTETPDFFETACIFLYTDDTNYFYTYETKNAIQSKPSRSGWHRVHINMSELQKEGAPDLASVAKVLIQVKATTGHTASIYFGLMSVFPSASATGMVTIRIDDGLESAKLALNALNIGNFAGVLSIIPSKVGTPGYLTADEIKVFEERGWDIVNHTMTEDALDESPVDVVRASIRGASEWMLEHGIVDNGVVVIPGHETSENVQVVTDELNVMTCSGRPGADTLPPEDWQMLRFLRCDGQSDETIAAYMANILADKSWGTLLIHDITESGGEYATRQEIVDVLAMIAYAGNVKIVTYSDVIRGV